MSDLTIYKLDLSPYSKTSLFFTEEDAFMKIGNNIYHFCGLVNDMLKTMKESVNSWYIVPDRPTENSEVEVEEKCFSSFIASLVNYNQIKDFSANVVIKKVEEGTKILVMLQDIGSKYYITLKNDIYYMTSSKCNYDANILTEGTEECEIFTINNNTEAKFFKKATTLLANASVILESAQVVSRDKDDASEDWDSWSLPWCSFFGIVMFLAAITGVMYFSKKEAKDNYDYENQSPVIGDDHKLDDFS